MKTDLIHRPVKLISRAVPDFINANPPSVAGEVRKNGFAA